MQAEGVGVSFPHGYYSMSPAGCCIAEGLEYRCVGRLPREPAAGESSGLRRVPSHSGMDDTCLVPCVL